MKVKLWVDPRGHQVYTKDNLVKSFPDGYEREMTQELSEMLEELLASEDIDEVMDMLKPEYAEQFRKEAEENIRSAYFYATEIEINIEGEVK